MVQTLAGTLYPFKRNMVQPSTWTPVAQNIQLVHIVRCYLPRTSQRKGWALQMQQATSTTAFSGQRSLLFPSPHAFAISRFTTASMPSSCQHWSAMSRSCGSKPTIPFWVFARHVRTYFSGHWDVHWGYGILTHGHVGKKTSAGFALVSLRPIVNGARSKQVPSTMTLTPVL